MLEITNALIEATKIVNTSFKNVSLIISDSVSYNLTAKKHLTQSYNNLNWITCVSHLSHNCCNRLSHFMQKKLSS